MLAKKISRFALAAMIGAAIAGCSKNDGAPAPKTETPKAESPKTQPSATADASKVNRPGVNDTPGTPSGADNKAPPPAKTDGTGVGSAAVTPPTTPVDLPAPTNGVNPPATQPVANPLFTLPPSKGPAPHKFQQLTLDRSGPSGALEMQLTGDGIYRIRDHGRGNSYAGDGKLTDAQIEEWAAAMKDWETLKEDYRADPKSKEGDKIEIFYGGKRVVINTADKDNPKIVTDAYKRLLDLNEQSKKESGATETPTPTPTPTPAVEAPKKEETPKKEELKPETNEKTAAKEEIQKAAKEIEKKVEAVQPESKTTEKEKPAELKKDDMKAEVEKEKSALKSEIEKEKSSLKEEVKKAVGDVEKKTDEVKKEAGDK